MIKFISSYQVKFPKACECLQKDKAVSFTFYDFLAQHSRIYARPTQSTFATVRLRTQ
jgi:putative transposase